MSKVSEGENMNILNLEVNKRGYIRILCLCILIVIVILIAYYISMLTYKSYNLEEDTIVANINEQDMNVHIDILETQGKTVEIAGWAYKENEKIKTINSNYILKNQETGEMYILRTWHEENINVPKDYKISGIHSRFILGNLTSGRYDIYVLYKNNNNNILAKTGVYLDV